MKNLKTTVLALVLGAFSMSAFADYREDHKPSAKFYADQRAQIQKIIADGQEDNLRILTPDGFYSERMGEPNKQKVAIADLTRRLSTFIAWDSYEATPYFSKIAEYWSENTGKNQVNILTVINDDLYVWKTGDKKKNVENETIKRENSLINDQSTFKAIYTNQLAAANLMSRLLLSLDTPTKIAKKDSFDYFTKKKFADGYETGIFAVMRHGVEISMLNKELLRKVNPTKFAQTSFFPEPLITGNECLMIKDHKTDEYTDCMVDELSKARKYLVNQYGALDLLIIDILEKAGVGSISDLDGLFGAGTFKWPQLDK